MQLKATREQTSGDYGLDIAVCHRVVTHTHTHTHTHHHESQARKAYRQNRFFLANPPFAYDTLPTGSDRNVSPVLVAPAILDQILFEPLAAVRRSLSPLFGSSWAAWTAGGRLFRVR